MIAGEFTPPAFYVSIQAIREAIREAIRNRHQFNILHLPSGLKVDVIVSKDTDFGRADISHGRRLKSEGFYDAWFGSPENVILMKLKYYLEGGSDKHVRDSAGILQIQGDRIDRTYLTEWAKRLGLNKELQLLFDEASKKPR